MYNGTYYVNSTGSRWVIYEKGKKIKISFERDNIIHIRTPLFFESWGNFAYARVTYNNKRINIFDYKIID